MMFVDITLVFYQRKDQGGGKNVPVPVEWKGIGCHSISTHAEMSAIMNFLISTKQIKGRRKVHGKTPFKGKVPKTLYVVSMYKGRWRNSRPCDDCIKVMRYYGVKRVIYSTGLTDPHRFLCVEKVDSMEFRGRSSGNRY